MCQNAQDSSGRFRADLHDVPSKVIPGVCQADGLDVVPPLDGLVQREDGHVVPQAGGVEPLVPDHSLDGVLGHLPAGLAGLLQVVVAQDHLQVLDVVLAHASRGNVLL